MPIGLHRAAEPLPRRPHPSLEIVMKKRLLFLFLLALAAFSGCSGQEALLDDNVAVAGSSAAA
jgi:hypothetical protein